MRGVATADGGDPPSRIIAQLTFRSMQHFQNAAGAYAAEILADLANFTDAPPVIQISDDFGLEN